jgi:thioredoxin reductase (NADPH)
VNFTVQIKSVFCFVCLFLMTICHANPRSLDKVDVIVLGGGAAGLTSGIYLGRAGLSTLVLEGPASGGAITQSNSVYNWPGYKEISGFDLMDKIREQADESGAVLSDEELVTADLSKIPFHFTVQNIYDKSKRREIQADACIIATGATARKLDVPGEKKYWSKGVYTCAVCDGALYKDRVVGVVGGGDSALLEADYLAGIAKKVYIFNRKDKFKGVENARKEKLLNLPNVEILFDVNVKEIQGDDDLVKTVVLLGNNGEEKTVDLDAVFLAIGAIPNTQYFSKQLELDSFGYISLKKGCETSVPGVFAAGDVADPIFKQAIIASGDGAKAAMQAGDYVHLKAPVKKKVIDQKSEKKKVVEAEAIEVGSISQLKEIVETSKTLVVLDFYATWCGPCRYLGKFTDQWAKELQGKAVFCKVNVDKAKDVAFRYKVQSMPTLVVLDDLGREIGRFIGVEEIVSYINQLKEKKTPN